MPRKLRDARTRRQNDDEDQRDNLGDNVFVAKRNAHITVARGWTTHDRQEGLSPPSGSTRSPRNAVAVEAEAAQQDQRRGGCHLMAMRPHTPRRTRRNTHDEPRHDRLRQESPAETPRPRCPGTEYSPPEPTAWVTSRRVFTDRIRE